MIISGELSEGDALPSMRLLAKDLRISVITTKRAYEELEREGYIISVTGKGSFVAPKNVEFIREENLKKIESLLQEVSELAHISGVELQELQQLLQMTYKGEV